MVFREFGVVVGVRNAGPFLMLWPLLSVTASAIPRPSLGNPLEGPTKSGKIGQVSIKRRPAPRQVSHCYTKLIPFYYSFHEYSYSISDTWIGSPQETYAKDLSLGSNVHVIPSTPKYLTWLWLNLTIVINSILYQHFAFQSKANSAIINHGPRTGFVPGHWAS